VTIVARSPCGLRRPNLADKQEARDLLGEISAGEPWHVGR